MTWPKSLEDYLMGWAVSRGGTASVLEEERGANTIGLIRAVGAAATWSDLKAAGVSDGNGTKKRVI